MLPDRQLQVHLCAGAGGGLARELAGLPNVARVVVTDERLFRSGGPDLHLHAPQSTTFAMREGGRVYQAVSTHTS